MHAPAFDRRALAWRLARLAGVVVVVVLVITTVPGLGSLRSRFARAQPGWIITACALQAGSVLCFALWVNRPSARHDVARLHARAGRLDRLAAR